MDILPRGINSIQYIHVLPVMSLINKLK